MQSEDETYNGGETVVDFTIKLCEIRLLKRLRERYSDSGMQIV